MTSRHKTAIILFAMGGPDNIHAVRPFLFNLFNDPAIIRLPQPLRTILAYLIAWKRRKIAQSIYEQLGGCSPLLKNTLAQAAALQKTIVHNHKQINQDTRVFVAMRYWHPFSDETARAVQEFDPDSIVLLPLYPQWSSTTSESSFNAWQASCDSINLFKPTRSIGSYPTALFYINCLSVLTQKCWDEAKHYGTPRLLFSAHGLPKSIINNGDPYRDQCEQTSAALAASLNCHKDNWVTCYQSRVGPKKWIGPSIAHEIERAARDKVPVIVVPIAFVSEHCETIIELDIEYRNLAISKGVPFYCRVQTVGTNNIFIEGLATLINITSEYP